MVAVEPDERVDVALEGRTADVRPPERTDRVLAGVARRVDEVVERRLAGGPKFVGRPLRVVDGQERPVDDVEQVDGGPGSARAIERGASPSRVRSVVARRRRLAVFDARPEHLQELRQPLGVVRPGLAGHQVAVGHHLVDPRAAGDLHLGARRRNASPSGGQRLATLCWERVDG